MLRDGVKLYFVRHGETDWNAAKRYQGQRDIALNATGRAQAARNGRVLQHTLADTAAALDYVASPLVRARETMEIIRRELGLPPKVYRMDQRLQEMNYGDWEGQLLEQLPISDPEGVSARKADAWRWQPRGGESYSTLTQRVAAWLNEVENDAIVVSHGGVSRALRGLVLPLARATVPFLEVPQDRVLVLKTGVVSWL
jgi:broad specificity phosphatase PhoE